MTNVINLPDPNRLVYTDVIDFAAATVGAVRPVRNEVTGEITCAPVVILDATHLSGRIYAVRPMGQIGTCGFYPVPWDVRYVKADNAGQAVLKAQLAEAKERAFAARVRAAFE